MRSPCASVFVRVCVSRGREDIDTENDRKCNPGSCMEPTPAACHADIPILHSQPTLGAGCDQSVCGYIETNIDLKESIHESNEGCFTCQRKRERESVYSHACQSTQFCVLLNSLLGDIVILNKKQQPI